MTELWLAYDWLYILCFVFLLVCKSLFNFQINYIPCILIYFFKVAIFFGIIVGKLCFSDFVPLHCLSHSELLLLTSLLSSKITYTRSWTWARETHFVSSQMDSSTYDNVYTRSPWTRVSSFQNSSTPSSIWERSYTSSIRVPPQLPRSRTWQIVSF